MIEVRAARAEDRVGLGELFEVCFGRAMGSEEWSWKYDRSPWGAVSYVTIDDGRVVGHYGGLGSMFVRGNDELFAYQFCDVMTHPGFRAKVFSRKPPIVRAGEMLYRDNSMDFAFGFPSERHARLQTVMLGGSPHQPVLLHTKMLTSRASDPPSAALAGSGNTSTDNTGSDDTDTNSSDTGWDRIRDEDVDRLWTERPGHSALATRKDGRYMRWRYQNHPTREYTPVVLRRGPTRSVGGVAVVSIEDGDLNVVELLSAGEKPLSDLLAAIAAVALAGGASAIRTWCHRNDAASSVLAASGFEPRSHIPCQMCVVRAEKLTDQEFHGNYCYRMGDYDAS